MELREKVARAIFEIDGYPPANVSEWGLEAADAILALPEIREALQGCSCGEQAIYCSGCAQEAYTPYD